MAKDAELDRLKEAQKYAFERKQSAFLNQQQKWDDHVAVKNELGKLYKERTAAQKNHDELLNIRQVTHSEKGKQIDHLNAAQEIASKKMNQAFNRAMSAARNNDEELGIKCTQEVGIYKSEVQKCISDRKQLVDEIRLATSHYQASRQTLKSIKSRFSEMKYRHKKSKSEHSKSVAEFSQAKEDYCRIANNFKARLEVVTNIRNRSYGRNRRLAEKAGVPPQYLDSVRVCHSKDKIDFYFGGINKPDGLGHGHYVTDEIGTVIHQRDPDSYKPPKDCNFNVNSRLVYIGNGTKKSVY